MGAQVWLGIGAILGFAVVFGLLYYNTHAAEALYAKALADWKTAPANHALSVPGWCYAWGILSAVVLLVIASVITSNNILSLVRGEDGRLSISKAQLLIWTATIAYTYGTLMAARAFFGHDLSALSNIPANVLIALGFSMTTAIGAKAITVNKIATGQVQKTDGSQQANDGTNAQPQTGLGGLVNNDDNCPDLTKVQLLFWTAVAVVVYIAQAHDSLLHFFTAHLDDHSKKVAAQCTVDGLKTVVDRFNDINCLALPNIDSTLMVFMGLAHGTYLGGKLTQADTPRIASITPQAIAISKAKSATPPTVTITGQDLGKVGVVYLDGAPYWGPKPPVFDDSSVTFDWPANDAPGNDWKAGRVVTITIESGGQRATADARVTLIP